MLPFETGSQRYRSRSKNDDLKEDAGTTSTEVTHFLRIPPCRGANPISNNTAYSIINSDGRWADSSVSVSLQRRGVSAHVPSAPSQTRSICVLITCVLPAMTPRHVFFMAAVLICAIASTYALECYTGFSYIRGQSLGTTKETCRNKGDFCYKFSAEANVLNKLKQAGCSTLRCMLSQNKCITQKISGHQVKLCCCNEYDLCNSAPVIPVAIPILLGLVSLLAFFP
ncbi:hypothetical protein QR680_000995 [Steinernema hermaphroditum]|uniref:Activin types I and II receptor domain-containing protein n=1 Tax=Steinernema hermaphroditum TaxID=289476 RepID=A0AA39LF98_9BILA|nr:hypothetical protein QR680_000995 [Steinernema hermaphroditum]